MKITYFLGRNVAMIILTLVYYFVITPAGLIKRLFGGSLLPLKPDKQVKSYWVTRTQTSQPKEQFFKRY